MKYLLVLHTSKPYRLSICLRTDIGSYTFVNLNCDSCDASITTCKLSKFLSFVQGCNLKNSLAVCGCMLEYLNSDGIHDPGP